jgi:hypothetical protein
MPKGHFQTQHPFLILKNKTPTKIGIQGYFFNMTKYFLVPT